MLAVEGNDQFRKQKIAEAELIKSLKEKVDALSTIDISEMSFLKMGGGWIVEKPVMIQTDRMLWAEKWHFLQPVTKVSDVNEALTDKVSQYLNSVSDQLGVSREVVLNAVISTEVLADNNQSGTFKQPPFLQIGGGPEGLRLVQDRGANFLEYYTSFEKQRDENVLTRLSGAMVEGLAFPNLFPSVLMFFLHVENKRAQQKASA